MNPEIKAQWVAALRSGEFQQGHGVLHQKREGKPDTYCCLGVLCVLAERAGVTQRWSHLPGTRVTYGTPGLDGSSSTTTLPRSVQLWAGLTVADGDPRNPVVKIKTSALSCAAAQPLSYLNDRGVPFSTIAKHIERYL